MPCHDHVTVSDSSWHVKLPCRHPAAILETRGIRVISYPLCRLCEERVLQVRWARGHHLRGASDLFTVPARSSDEWNG